ncbi:hypothetical protein [Coxiella burnetii]|uniref:Hypothetical exported protein n=2 Tax=Coxiella burnetii TaxID=777 RepID=Q83DJ9_COXBU|nr:hypothetical protein [Coxiella burnetii]NP_819757.2 hypothetical protein CBU_0731 [Coxiella burnetii RSA 493]AAO90271.2 hypothetical exported protein [Coxiella burnetii RSA 493]ABS76668.2 hypothetical exported protein [Coxiella burnetii Dugway 5J108-111]ACJ18594.1 hypothetical exported protein [Coxiella burnetii CbuG_Q212]ARI65572.1 hypothetical protein B7L74_03700 [Coxiella burnetii]ARK27048.1 hypothetical protein BMW92_03585 [Coxiella burnetii]
MAIVYNCFIFIHMKRKERMKRYSSVCLAVLGGFVAIGLSTAILAANCPKNMQKDAKGYWTSNEPPGWKSYRPSESDSTLEPKDFGGAVYSPAKKRIACAYKTTNNKWAILLSSVYYPFEASDLKSTTWKYNPQHKDYICGSPKQTLDTCQFEIKNN